MKNYTNLLTKKRYILNKDKKIERVLSLVLCLSFISLETSNSL